MQTEQFALAKAWMHGFVKGMHWERANDGSDMPLNPYWGSQEDEG